MTYAAPTAAHNGKLGFNIHAATYVVAVPALIALNLLTGGYLWAVWPRLGWTIGLLAHAIWGVRWTNKA